MFSTCDGNSYVRREKVISGCLYSLPSVQHEIPWLRLESLLVKRNVDILKLRGKEVNNSGQLYCLCTAKLHVNGEKLILVKCFHPSHKNV